MIGALCGIIGRKINRMIDNEMIDRLFNYSSILIIVICFYNFFRNL